jgi:hypothetical protein
LNCGTGSSPLKAEVKAFDRLQIVRERIQNMISLISAQGWRERFASFRIELVMYL